MKPIFSLALLLALLAAPNSLAQTPTAPATYEAETQDLLSTLEARGNFTTLVSALRDTGLDDALAAGEAFTLFAPNDEAFQELPAGTLEGLSSEQLIEILRYHILVGAVPAQDATALESVPSVEGTELDLSTTDGQLMVNGATVTEADIQASNGVIHVIDSVLMPEAEMDDASMQDEMMEKEMEMEDDSEMEDDGDMAPAPQDSAPQN